MFFATLTITIASLAAQFVMTDLPANGYPTRELCQARIADAVRRMNNAGITFTITQARCDKR